MNYENLCCFLTESPKFSVKPGKYNEPRTVKIMDSTAGATIYYTTDGWTPTAASQRYAGPIKVRSTTMLGHGHFSAHRAQFCQRAETYD